MTTTPLSVYCPACGQQIPAGAGFCRECGHRLPARAETPDPEVEASTDPATKACPHCGVQLPVAAQFCGSCGGTVTVDEPPPEPATLVPNLNAEPPSAPEPEPEPAPPADATGPGRQLNGRVAAIGAATVLLVGGGIAAALALSGDSSPNAENAARAGTNLDSAPIVRATPEATVAAPTPEATIAPPTATPTSTPTPEPEPTVDTGLSAQVHTLDGLMQLSVQGRAAAVAGDTAAATASRSNLLRQLQSLRAEAADARLQGALDRFIAAIRESLRQNRQCGSACSAADLVRVGRLKNDALSRLNPLLREYVGRTYRREEI